METTEQVRRENQDMLIKVSKHEVDIDHLTEEVRHLKWRLQ